MAMNAVPLVLCMLEYIAFYIYTQTVLKILKSGGGKYRKASRIHTLKILQNTEV